MSANLFADAEQLKILSTVKIGIAGAGGLGSNCAAHLVRSGVAHLKIVDFDVVSAGNLNRQFFFAAQIGQPKVTALRENLLAIEPQTDIELVQDRLTAENTAGIFKDCAVVVEAVDKADVKQMLIRTLLANGKNVVAASGIGGIGKSNLMRVTRLNSKLVVAGDGETEVDNVTCFPWSPRVGIASAMQANCVLSIILGVEI